MSRLFHPTAVADLPAVHPKYGMFYIEEAMRDAAYQGSVSMLKRLATAYPQLDVNAADEYGQTALYIACKRGQHEAADWLLDQPNIDVKAATSLGNDALLISAWNDDTVLAQKLLDHGADPHARTHADRQYHGGVSARDVADERGNAALVKLLLAAESQADIQPTASIS